MKDSGTIVVTGGAGFIGSNLIANLNSQNIKDIIVVDNLLHNQTKKENLHNLFYDSYYDKNAFLNLIEKNELKGVDVIVHLGARTDTTEKNKEFLLQNNTEYSKKLYNYCLQHKTRFIYASSAATYGDGSQGYSDKTRDLKPLNNYGLSKYLFDEWVLNNAEKPAQWVGLKFFNVYGPNEYHKGEMASVIFHGYNQIKQQGNIKLFKSYKKTFADGKQKRDFIYVKDVISIILFFINNPEKSGIFNVGTGKARSFLSLAKATFQSMNLSPNITFIDMPEYLKGKYQYFTQADITSLRKAGYKNDFYELEQGIADYVQNYLDNS